jgi:hypothetical protein
MLLKNNLKNHNYSQNEMGIEKKEIKNQLKRKVEENPTIPTMQVYNEVQI